MQPLRDRERQTGYQGSTTLQEATTMDQRIIDLYDEYTHAPLDRGTIPQNFSRIRPAPPSPIDSLPAAL